MRRELEDEQSRWGEQIRRKEWEKLDVGSVKQWCEKVEDRSWLASKIGGRKKEKRRDSKGSNDKRGNVVVIQWTTSHDTHGRRRRSVGSARKERG